MKNFLEEFIGQSDYRERYKETGQKQIKKQIKKIIVVTETRFIRNWVLKIIECFNIIFKNRKVINNKMSHYVDFDVLTLQDIKGFTTLENNIIFFVESGLKNKEGCINFELKERLKSNYRFIEFPKSLTISSLKNNES